MQASVALAIAQIPKHGFDGNPPVMRELRDIPGRGKRKIDGTQNIACDRLEWYHAHGYIEQHHLEAGRKLEGHWQLSQIGGYASGGGEGGRVVRLVPSDLPDAKCDAIQAVNEARAALDASSWHLVELVVLQNAGLHVAAKRLWRHSRRGEAQKALVHALEKLAQHFGLA